MPRETRSKKRITKARFAGKFDFFDKLNPPEVIRGIFGLFDIRLNSELADLLLKQS